MKIAILGMGNPSVRVSAIIEELNKQWPGAEIVFVDETDEVSMADIKGDAFDAIALHEAPIIPPYLGQFDHNYDGIRRKGRGERKRNKSNRWR